MQQRTVGEALSARCGLLGGSYRHGAEDVAGRIRNQCLGEQAGIQILVVSRAEAELADDDLVLIAIRGEKEHRERSACQQLDVASGTSNQEPR